MKEYIIAIAILLLIIFISLSLYKASKLRNIQITQKVRIKAPIEEVFNQVRYFKNFPQWSPFYEADPSQQYEIKGEDGQIGAEFHWNGNKGKDIGYQKLTKLKKLEYIKMDCEIEKPFSARPSFEYLFNETGQYVEVIQEFNLKSSLIDSFFMWLFGAKKDMEKMNKRGMELLKASVDK